MVVSTVKVWRNQVRGVAGPIGGLGLEGVGAVGERPGLVAGSQGLKPPASSWHSMLVIVSLLSMTEKIGTLVLVNGARVALEAQHRVGEVDPPA